MEENCEKCHKHLIEYNSPGNWCRYCWVDWWVAQQFRFAGMEIDEQEREKYYADCLREIDEVSGNTEN